MRTQGLHFRRSLDLKLMSRFQTESPALSLERWNRLPLASKHPNTSRGSEGCRNRCRHWVRCHHEILGGRVLMLSVASGLLSFPAPYHLLHDWTGSTLATRNALPRNFCRQTYPYVFKTVFQSLPVTCLSSTTSFISNSSTQSFQTTTPSQLFAIC